jgi:probable phosphoglycerate mutase
MLLSDTFDACFISPLARSRRTAEIIWDSRDKDLIPDYDLREIDLYSFQVGVQMLGTQQVLVGMPYRRADDSGSQGLLKHEGKEKYGALFQQWQTNAPSCSIDGHYPVQELWDRAQNCWERILAHEGKSVLVVAHNAVNQALIATSLGRCYENFMWIL